jgi:soluble lytic murein transglycosylase
MARSAADARGLMQVLPSVGATIARAERFPEWDPVLLYQPDVNLAIGIRHLATRLRRVNGSTEVALASYNAGPTPTSRWLRLRGTHDPEVFVERIPFVETRDYVRRVLYNWERYATLYGPAETGPGGR